MQRIAAVARRGLSRAPQQLHPPALAPPLQGGPVDAAARAAAFLPRGRGGSPRRRLRVAAAAPAAAPAAAEAGATSSAQHARETPRRGRGPWAEALFFGLPVATTFALGVWQVRRLDRKRNLIADRVARLAEDPLTGAQLAALALPGGDPTGIAEQLDHRRVVLRGTFVVDKSAGGGRPVEMLVGPRPAPSDVPSSVLTWGGTSGFKVVAPFLTEQGRTVLVIRGWIPQRLASHEDRRAATVTPFGEPWEHADDETPRRVESDRGEGLDGDDASATIAIQGIMRSATEERNRFTPDNCPRTGDWYYIDAAQMADAISIADETRSHGKQAVASAPGVDMPLVVELSTPTPPNGWPHPRPLDEYVTFRTPPSTHVIYAVTWFSLSAALALLTRQRYSLRARADVVTRSRAS
jgi:cytochrome oxidase assembly protein ShyY1